MLSSVEVGTLIKALGCGIGREEFNIDKLRYHSIIIMTDADVDGAHIRTLLLTFFFRQMPVMVERGHIFIAQPPLYKIKRGKQEQYLKDEQALSDYLTHIALEKSALHPNPDAPAISDHAFETLVHKYHDTQEVIDRSSNIYPSLLLEAMLELPRITETELKDEVFAKDWAEKFQALLPESGRTGSHYKVVVEKDGERGTTNFNVEVMEHGIPHNFLFNYEFFMGTGYKKIADMGEELQAVLEEGAYLQRGERVLPIENFKKTLAWLLNEARKGHYIQRYKGLGEMNPEQLWDTTMDPEHRRMLQVTIEDAVAADQIFTTLMGDEVEPRRKFIESNALRVANLDF
jgi:DNA gyrase subunit B